MTPSTPPIVDLDAVRKLRSEFDEPTGERIQRTVDRIVEVKRRGGKVAVVTGSGPNLHEGATTLVAELMRVGIVDGVTTSSAVVAHEMAGVLDWVKRVDGRAAKLPPEILPKGGGFELTLFEGSGGPAFPDQVPHDRDLVDRLSAAPGETVLKAAGNLGYPMGLWIERLSEELLAVARNRGESFERIAGLGADLRTTIGVGAELGKPVLVTIPQLVGGGTVGLAIGDSLSIAERAARVADLLADAEVIVESGVALTQEIHDGPFETYTGHGLWAAWRGEKTFSLEGKTLVRIDLDPNLERVWEIERGAGAVQDAVRTGVPKTKTFGVPFRMEMSGFARLEGSLPIVGDLGAVWPVLALGVAEALGIELSFMSYPQQTARGKEMREWIAREIRPFSRAKMETCLNKDEGGI